MGSMRPKNSRQHYQEKIIKENKKVVEGLFECVILYIVE